MSAQQHVDTVATETEIVLRGVAKTFFAGSKERSDVLALDDINMEVRRGEIYSLVGPSGCGKSTILNMIAGFEHPTQGDVIVDGRRVSAPGPDRVVVFQQPLLYPWLTVWKNIALGPSLAARRGADLDGEVQALIDATGLRGFEKHYPYELSGGMQQRVTLCRALINHPEVLLMDEPFGALDAITRVNMQELLMSVWEGSRPTIFFITHDIEEAIFIGDRVGLMSRRPGRIKHEFDVPLARPRDYRESTTAHAFVELKRRIASELEMKE